MGLEVFLEGLESCVERERRLRSSVEARSHAGRMDELPCGGVRVGLRCCVVHFTIIVAPSRVDGGCGRIYITLQLCYPVLREGVCAILIMMDMEDCEMTMREVPMSPYLFGRNTLSCV